MRKRRLDMQKAAELFEQGWTVQDITKEIGATNSHWVVQRLHQMGYAEASIVPIEKLDTGKMHALANAGWPIEKIADEMGITPKKVMEAMSR